jgi:hypothetical protein
MPLGRYRQANGGTAGQSDAKKDALISDRNSASSELTNRSLDAHTQALAWIH